jgi:predicted exporter
MMRSDIRRMSLGALLLVTCIAWFFFRNIRMVAAALAPVVSALAVMALFTVLSGGQFNMMHLLMGIMVTGLSIDYGIFMVCAVRDGHTASTVRAVVLCALSTISGFGILALAQHPVIKSLGETVLAGIGASLPAALLVTPCIMRAVMKKNVQK